MMKRDDIRFWLGALLAPVIPIVVFAAWHWVNTGNDAWFYFFFTFGYFFNFLFGLPIMGVLKKRKKFVSCLMAGGIVPVLPIVVLSTFSVFSNNKLYDVEMFKGVGVIFVSGSAAGALFWVIAFGGNDRKNAGAGANTEMRKSGGREERGQERGPV